MSSVLMTSTMKSEPGTPPMREVDNSFGVPISAAATCAVGGSAEGIRGAAPVEALVAALAGGTAVAPLATATPAKNLRRLTAACECLRLINFLPFHAAPLRGQADSIELVLAIIIELVLAIIRGPAA